jgi:hypothetical protein
MKQRVSIVEGKQPFIIVAPYGADDSNTDTLVHVLAKKHLNCYGVINWGWERSTKVNWLQDKADCGNIQHCHQDVVFDEFLNPLLRFKKRIIEQNHNVFILILTGQVKNSLPPNIDGILGYGQGESYSCEEWKARIFGFIASEEGVKIYGARPATALSGHTSKSLNQLFTKWYPDNRVESLILDISSDFLKDNNDIKILSEFLAKIIQRYHYFFTNWPGQIGKFPDLPTI